MPYVYILRCRDGSLYAGWTTNLEARLARHTDGTAAKYTRSRRPVTLVYSELHQSKSAALKREHQIKSWTRAGKQALIAERDSQRSSNRVTILAMPTKKRVRRKVPSMVTAVVRPVSNRLSRMEDLLIEMRSEQDVKLRKINKLQQQFDELTDIVKRRLSRREHA